MSNNKSSAMQRFHVDDGGCDLHRDHPKDFTQVYRHYGEIHGVSSKRP